MAIGRCLLPASAWLYSGGGVILGTLQIYNIYDISVLIPVLTAYCTVLNALIPHLFNAQQRMSVTSLL